MFRTFTTKQISEGFNKLYYDFKIHRIYSNGLNSCSADIENYNIMNNKKKMHNISHIIVVSQTYSFGLYNIKTINNKLAYKENTRIMYISSKDNYIYYKFENSSDNILYVYENNSKIVEAINKGNYEPEIMNKIVEILFKDQSRHDLFREYETMTRINISQAFIKKERITNCNLTTISKILNKYSAFADKFTIYFMFGFLEVRIYENNIEPNKNGGYFKIKVKNVNNQFTENHSIRYTYSYKTHNLDCYDVFLTGYNQHSMIISIPNKTSKDEFNISEIFEDHERSIIFFMLYKYYKSIY